MAYSPTHTLFHAGPRLRPDLRDKSLVDRATVESQSPSTWAHYDLNKPVDAAKEAERIARVALDDHIKLCGCSPSAEGETNIPWYLYRVVREIRIARIPQLLRVTRSPDRFFARKSFLNANTTKGGVSGLSHRPSVAPSVYLVKYIYTTSVAAVLSTPK